MTVLGTATTPTATATAAATAISIVLALAIVFRSTIFVLGAVVSGVLIVCLLIARATTAAAAVPRPSRLCSPLSAWSSFVSSSCVLEEGLRRGRSPRRRFRPPRLRWRPRLRFSELRSSSLFSSCVLASEGSGAEGLPKRPLNKRPRKLPWGAGAATEAEGVATWVCAGAGCWGATDFTIASWASGIGGAS